MEQDGSYSVNDVERLADRVRREGIFSNNEEQEDVNTTSLSLLLVDFLLAEMTGNVKVDFGDRKTGGPRRRLALVRRQHALFSVFLERCSSYKILRRAEEERYRSRPPTASAAILAQFHARTRAG